MSVDGRVGLNKILRSYKDIISRCVGDVEDLEKGAAHNDEEEDSQENRTNFVFLLFFLSYSTRTSFLNDLSMLSL